MKNTYAENEYYKTYILSQTKIKRKDIPTSTIVSLQQKLFNKSHGKHLFSYIVSMCGI